MKRIELPESITQDRQQRPERLKACLAERLVSGVTRRLVRL